MLRKPYNRERLKSGAARPETRKRPFLESRCYAAQTHGKNCVTVEYTRLVYTKQSLSTVFRVPLLVPHETMSLGSELHYFIAVKVGADA